MRCVVVLVSSLAIVACTPSLDLLDGGGGGILGGGGGGGILGTISDVVHTVIEAPSIIIKEIVGSGYHGGVMPVVTGGLFQALGFFTGGLTDVVGKDRDIFEDTVSLRLGGVLEDGFSSLIVVGRADGGIINALIPGLGTLLANLVIAIGKIFVCILSATASKNSLICQKDYLTKYGYVDISGGGSASEVTQYYKVKDPQQQAQKIINDYTKGKGVAALSTNERLVYEHVLIFGSFFDKDCSKWTSEDLKKYAVSIVVVTCILIESQQKGLGHHTLDEYFDILAKYNKNKHFPDLSSSQDDIHEILDGVELSTWGGAYIKTHEGVYGTIVTVKKQPIFPALTTYAEHLTDAAGRYKTILTDIALIKRIDTLEDGFNPLVVVGRADGGVANMLIPGLGDLMSNIVIAFGKIFICGRVPPGGLIPAFCDKNYFSKYGYNDIDSYSSISKIIKYYNVGNAQQQAEKFINVYTKGQGESALSVNEKIINDRAKIFTTLIDKECGKWDDNDLTTFTVNIVTLTCVLIESQQKNLGRNAIDDYIAALEKYNEDSRFIDLTVYRQGVYDIIAKVQQTTWNGAYNCKS